MGWKCQKCGKGTDSDNLHFPMMHGYVCDGDVVPDMGTVQAWAKVIA